MKKQKTVITGKMIETKDRLARHNIVKKVVDTMAINLIQKPLMSILNGTSNWQRDH